MITITPAKFSHIKELQRMDGSLLTGAIGDDNLKALVEQSTCFSMLGGDLVLGCGGVIMQWPGVGLLWMLASADLRRRPRLLLSVSLDMVERIRTRGKLHRLQVFIDPSAPRHIRFAEALGFTFEGRMIKHTAEGKDHLLYARTY